MPYDRERLQVLNSIKRAGNGEQVTVEVTSGGGMGAPQATQQAFTAYFAQVNYSSKDVADPTIANGLMKIIIPAINDAGAELSNFNSVLNKSAKVVFTDGTKVGIKMAKVTQPDHKTPILARLFLGG